MSVKLKVMSLKIKVMSLKVGKKFLWISHYNVCCEPLILFTYILVDIERHVTLTYCIVVTSVLTRDIFFACFCDYCNFLFF